MLLFGTKRLRNIGGDLGGAISGFRKAIKETDEVQEGLALDAAQKPAAQRESQQRA